MRVRGILAGIVFFLHSIPDHSQALRFSGKHLDPLNYLVVPERCYTPKDCLLFCCFSYRLRVNIEIQILAIWVHGSFGKVPLPSPCYFLRQGLTLPGAYLFGQTGWPGIPSDHPTIFISCMLGLQVCVFVLSVSTWMLEL